MRRTLAAAGHAPCLLQVDVLVGESSDSVFPAALSRGVIALFGEVGGPG